MCKCDGVSDCCCANKELGPEERELVGCDEEFWIKDRIKKAVELCMAVSSRKGVAANELLVEGAIDGIINGCAVEVVRTLGKEPSFVNLSTCESFPSTDCSAGILISGPSEPSIGYPMGKLSVEKL